MNILVKYQPTWVVFHWNFYHWKTWHRLLRTFQEQLAVDIKEIKSTNKIIVPADETRDLNHEEKEDYKKYLKDNITKTYKKSTNSKVNRVDRDAKKVADKLLMSDKVDQLEKHDKYITVKNYKESFLHNPSFRLINLSKSDIGKVTKANLDRMNKEIASSIQVEKLFSSN